MTNTERSDLLNGIAARMRAEAKQTFWPEYQGMMIRAAQSLENEADDLMEIRFARFH